MSATERDPDFAAPTVIDLTSQDNMFLVLEEMGIAHMQREWLEKHNPHHEDAAAVKEQAREFFFDLIAILSGRASAERIVQNGWAGAKLSAHLREALKEELTTLISKKSQASAPALEALDDGMIVMSALECYLHDIEVLTAMDVSLKEKGSKVAPADYIALMAGWSALFCGKADQLIRPQAFVAFKETYQIA